MKIRKLFIAVMLMAALLCKDEVHAAVYDNLENTNIICSNWVSNVHYFEGDFAVFDGSMYICLVEHDSQDVFDETLWQKTDTMVNVKLIKDKVNETGDKIGGADDGNDSNTLFGFLKKITSNIGSSEDTEDTSTLFGKLNGV